MTPFSAVFPVLAQIDFKKFTHDYLIPWGGNAVFALGILLLGLLVSKWISSLVAKALERSRLDRMLARFLISILRWVLYLAVLLTALGRLGVQTTSFIAILGAAGLAVGLALKDSLQNFASGVLLILFRPFKEGDFVEAGGTAGIVEDIKIFNTVLRTPDNRGVIVPNGAIYSGNIVNNHTHPTRRIDLVVGIGYEDDLRQAKQILDEIVATDERILEDPAPFIAVGELGDSSVDLLVRPWTRTDDYFQVKCDLTEKIKLAFDDAGITIPYPQMDLHWDGEQPRVKAG